MSALIAGIARWLRARAPDTRVIGVCSRGAPAMAESFARGPGGGLVSHDGVDTFADGIVVRVPIREAVDDLFGLVDEMLLVDDDALLLAMRLLHEHAGIVAEPASAAGLAAIVAEGARFAGARVATPICGGNLTVEQMGRWRRQA